MGERLPAKAAENWDLHAVVNSFSSAATTANNARGVNTTDENNSCSENPLSFLATLKFEEEDDPFSFPELLPTRNYGFEELQDSYKPFFHTPSSSRSVPQQLSEDLQQQQQRLQSQQVQQLNTSTSTTFPVSPTCSPLVFGENQTQQPRHVHQQSYHLLQDLQQQPQNLRQQQQQQPVIGSALPLRPVPSQTPRSRKRKTPQKRLVCHVTAENLSADLWAWRKYGQKPIKGSPYPRNYYRCSSSKGCAARKQVERSNTDPNIFIISYTGDHTHPRPTHRNSLAGSTRNKLSRTQNPDGKDSTPPTIANASCSSTLSATCHSPRAPPAPTDEDKNSIENNHREGADKERKKRDSKGFVEEDHYLDDLLIPNLAAAIDEDFFEGLKEFGTSAASGGGSG